MVDGASNGVVRRRAGYVLATVVVIAAGLATRPLRSAYPVAMDALGDALWAAMVFLALSAAWPEAPIWKRAAGAAALAFAVEFSQMYHAPWMDRIRATLPGHLVLGQGFEPWDLVKYLVGVGAAAGVAGAATRR